MTTSKCRMNNIILIGMSGAGKSTLGVLLAKQLGYDFVDTDLLIQEKHQALLQELIDEQGIDKFKQYEEEMLLGLTAKHCVVATGGSVVYSQAGMEHLKQLGVLVYIDVDPLEIARRLESIQDRGIVIREGQTMAMLCKERDKLYRWYMDKHLLVGDEPIEVTVRRLGKCLVKNTTEQV